jgi:hypothetical protein
MEIIPLGETALPMEIILEYMDSLKQIYTPEVCVFRLEGRKKADIEVVLRPVLA